MTATTHWPAGSGPRRGRTYLRQSTATTIRLLLSMHSVRVGLRGDGCGSAERRAKPDGKGGRDRGAGRADRGVGDLVQALMARGRNVAPLFTTRTGLCTVKPGRCTY